MVSRRSPQKPKKKDLESLNFEKEVASLYRELGAEVQHDIEIAGMQIDVLAVGETPDGATIRTAVECKRYSRPLGVNVVAEATQRLASLRLGDQIDKGVIISSNGFTKSAKIHADQLNVSCFTIQELRNRLIDFGSYIENIASGQMLPKHFAEVQNAGTFINLNAESQGGKKIDSIVDYLIGWLKGPGQLTTLLGEYGSGKTTTCWHIVHNLSLAITMGGVARIPILIELRQFGSYHNILSFVWECLTKTLGIRIASFQILERQIQDGRFLFIFDGLDEIASHIDPAMVFRVVDDILKLQRGKSKTIITCRTSFFRDEADLAQLRKGNDLESMLHRHTGYRVLFLQGLTEEQVEEYLSAYFGDDWLSSYVDLWKEPKLRRLMERPILLSMIAKTAVAGKALAPESVTELYDRYTEVWLDRDNWRCQLSPSVRRGISQAIAVELLRTGSSRLHHSELRTLLVTYFEEPESPERLERFAHEVRTCTFLRNDLLGYYSFVHRSFAEFLLARFIADEIELGKISALELPATYETLYFLAEIIKKRDETIVTRLWEAARIIEEEKGEVETKRRRANALFLLLKCEVELGDAKFDDLFFPDLIEIDGLDLSGATCRNITANHISACSTNLSQAVFSGATIQNGKFNSANLKETVFNDSDMRGCDFWSTDLRGASFQRSDLEDILIAPTDIRKYEIISAEAQVIKSRANMLQCCNPDDFTTRELTSTSSAERQQSKKRSLLAWNTLGKKIDRCSQVFEENGAGKATAACRMLRTDLSNAAKQVEMDYKHKIVRTDSKIQELRQSGESIYSEVARKKRYRLVLRKKRVRQQRALLSVEELERSLKLYEDLISKPLPTSHSEGVPNVVNAIFTDSKGLTEDQYDWLERNGAIVSRRTINSSSAKKGK